MTTKTTKTISALRRFLPSFRKTATGLGLGLACVGTMLVAPQDAHAGWGDFYLDTVVHNDTSTRVRVHIGGDLPGFWDGVDDGRSTSWDVSDRLFNDWATNPNKSKKHDMYVRIYACTPDGYCDSNDASLVAEFEFDAVFKLREYKNDKCLIRNLEATYIADGYDWSRAVDEGNGRHCSLEITLEND